MSLFTGYDFKKFGYAVREISPRYTGQMIRQLYSGYVYPELEFYLKIEDQYRERVNSSNK